MEQIDFSFIVINRNNEKYIEKCLSSIEKIKHISKEIILVDDFSTDNSLSVITTKPTTIINLSSNEGIANARKEGLRVSRGKYAVFIDSDIELTSFVPQDIVGVFSSSKKIIGIVGKYESPSSKKYNWNAVLDARRRDIQLKDSTGFQFDTKRYTTFSGGFCVYKKMRLFKLGGKGEIGLAAEDLFQQIELLHRGYQFYYLPSFSGSHHHHRSLIGLLHKAKSEAKGEIWLVKNAIINNINIPIFDPVFTFPGLVAVSLLLFNPLPFTVNYFPNILLIFVRHNKEAVALFIYQIYKDMLKMLWLIIKLITDKEKIVYLKMFFRGTVKSIIGKTDWVVRFVTNEKYSFSK